MNIQISNCWLKEAIYQIQIQKLTPDWWDKILRWQWWWWQQITFKSYVCLKELIQGVRIIFCTDARNFSSILIVLWHFTIFHISNKQFAFSIPSIFSNNAKRTMLSVKEDNVLSYWYKFFFYCTSIRFFSAALIAWWEVAIFTFGICINILNS